MNGGEIREQCQSDSGSVLLSDWFVCFIVAGVWHYPIDLLSPSSRVCCYPIGLLSPLTREYAAIRLQYRVIN